MGSSIPSLPRRRSHLACPTLAASLAGTGCRSNSLIPSSPIWSEYKIRPYPCLESSITTQAALVIIGAGFTGLSAAYHLLKKDPGKTVIVLEAGKLGAGASGHTTGILGPGVGRRVLSLANRYGPQTAQALYRATIEAVNTFSNLITNEGIDCELEMTGQII